MGYTALAVPTCSSSAWRPRQLVGIGVVGRHAALVAPVDVDGQPVDRVGAVGGQPLVAGPGRVCRRRGPSRTARPGGARRPRSPGPRRRRAGRRRRSALRSRRASYTPSGAGRGQGVLPDDVRLQVGQRFGQRRGEGIVGQGMGAGLRARRAGVEIVRELGPGRDRAAQPGPADLEDGLLATPAARSSGSRRAGVDQAHLVGAEAELGCQPAAQQLAGADLAGHLDPLDRAAARAGGRAARTARRAAPARVRAGSRTGPPPSGAGPAPARPAPGRVSGSRRGCRRGRRWPPPAAGRTGRACRRRTRPGRAGRTG